MYNNSPQKRKSSHIIKTALIISWLIILAGVYYVFFWNGGSTPTPSSPTNTGEQTTGDSLTSNYYIGEQIISEGQIEPVDSFTTYTHTFTSEDGQQFGLKSTKHDLYQYTGSVQIKGTIDDYRNELPIILVTEVYGQRATDSLDTGEVANEEFYLFEDVRLGFDLSISQGFRAEQREQNIVLIDTAGESEEVVLTVSPFSCSSVEPLRDCASLQDKFIEYGNESFVSSNNITFYNLTETNTWAAFNGTSYGYYLTPVSERNLVDFVNLMVFVDEIRLQEAVEDEVATLCQNIDTAMTDIYALDATYGDDGRAELDLQGTTDSGEDATCSVVVRLGNNFQFTLKSFSVTDEAAPLPDTEDEGDDNETETPPQEDEQPDSEDEDEEETTPPGDDEAAVTPPTFEEPADNTYENWLSYKSVRGYTLYFSNQSISYAGETREATDLGVGGISCTYQVNVIQWERAEEIDENPDLVIYECTGEPNQGDIAANNLLYVGETGENIFIAKYLNSNLSTTQIAVEGE